MNAPLEPTFFYVEGKKEGISIPDIVGLFRAKIDRIETYKLREGINELMVKIQERMTRGDLGRAVTLIHNIPLEYSLYDRVTTDERGICNAIYTDLLAIHDRVFMSIFPDQFRKRTDQILQKTPE